MDIIFGSVDHDTREKNIAAFAATVHHDVGGPHALPKTGTNASGGSIDEEDKTALDPTGVVVAAARV
jgi:hypothetical protein